MGGVADEAVAHPGLGGPLGSKRNRLHHRHRAEPSPAVEHESGDAVLRERRLGRDIDLAAFDHPQIKRQPRNTVSIDAAQIGPDQSVGNNGCILGARALAFKCIANEAGQSLMPDDDFALAHAPFLTLSI